MRTRWAYAILLLTAAAIIISGCQWAGGPTATPKLDPSPSRTPIPLPTERSSSASATSVATPEDSVLTATPQAVTPTPLRAVRYGYTYQRADGNRVVMGQGAFPDAKPTDVQLAGEPRWVAAASVGEGYVWVVVLRDGKVQGFRTVGGNVEAMAIEPAELQAGMPPLLKVEDSILELVKASSPEASPLTHPAILKDSGRLAFITKNGDLVVWKGGTEVARLAVDALPDSRLLVDEKDRVLLLTAPTSRYGHGVLGDEIEASAITLVEIEPAVQVARTIFLPGQGVVEGVAPIWADLNGDGQREIVVTVSNADEGARIVVFDELGVQVTEGPAIGRGFRWRHQLAVGPFGPNGDLELADVLTPHIGGVVEFYEMEGDQLRIVAEVPGYSSHTLGSRNLDMAAGGDFDGDGRWELLVPDQTHTALAGIRRTTDGIEVAWNVPVDGRISTNLATATLSSGRLAVGLGRSDDVLRLWLP